MVELQQLRDYHKGKTQTQNMRLRSIRMPNVVHEGMARSLGFRKYGVKNESTSKVAQSRRQLTWLC
jgi:hypothetical protein